MNINEPKFSYGPISKGCFYALVSSGPLVFIYAPQYLGWYISLVLFLALGLRWVLEKSGLYDRYQELAFWLSERCDRKFVQKRRIEVTLKERDKKYRWRRTRDQRLPDNW